MSKKEKLEKTIKDLQSALDKAQEELKNFDSYERFVPSEDEKYYCIDYAGDVLCDTNDLSSEEIRIIKFYNCFRTKEEAENEREKILVRRMLEDIANRLNKGKKIDWTNDCQRKVGIAFDNGRLCQFLDYIIKKQGTVYCLSNIFLNVAKKEIGEERLIKYIKGE